jgi:hypothetical protein
VSDDERKAAEQARVAAAIRRAFGEITDALTAEREIGADVYDALLSLTIEAEARAAFLGSMLIHLVGTEIAPDLTGASCATRLYAAKEACRRIVELRGLARVH